MSKEIKKILEDYKEETQKYFDQKFDQKTGEVKRHFEVVAERLEDKIQAVSEQVVANTESIVGIKESIVGIQDKLEEHDQQFNRLEENLEAIKLDTEFIKNELPQKVSREEFVVLEKRASLLEARNRS